MAKGKSIIYEIKDLVSDDNQDLFDEVSKRINIKLVPQTGTWSAHIDSEGNAVIGYTQSKYPDAAFAHELLHIKAELDGLKDPNYTTIDPIVSIELIRYLINQFAHHRIYPEFYDLGFLEDEFLHDNDSVQARSTLRRDVPKLEGLYRKKKQNLSGFSILLPYLICISPHETSKEIFNYKDRILKIADPEFIKEVDEIMDEWVKSKRMDYCLTFAKLFKACGIFNVSFSSKTDLNINFSPSSV